jgi:hypothetical protein
MFAGNLKFFRFQGLQIKGGNFSGNQGWRLNPLRINLDRNEIKARISRIYSSCCLPKIDYRKMR